MNSQFPGATGEPLKDNDNECSVSVTTSTV